MSRTTAAAVKKILDTDISASDLEPFVSDANVVIDRISSNLTAAEAEAAEKWYAAHLASAWDQRHESASGGGTRVDYQGEFEAGLYSTDYGQRADQMTGGALSDELEKGTTSVTTVQAGPQE